MDQVSPRTLALWEAFYRVEPWGDDYARSAIQSQLTDSLTSVVAASYGVERKHLAMKDFMPGNWDNWQAQTKKKPKSNIAVAHKMIATRFPTADRRR